MLDDEFNKQRAKLLHELAHNADPFIKRRLLDLAKRYEQQVRQKATDRTFSRWNPEAEPVPAEAKLPASAPSH